VVRVGDTYGVEVAPGGNDVLVLAAATVIDTMAHTGPVAPERDPPASPWKSWRAAALETTPADGGASPVLAAC
jgi:hypothetical protein